MNATRAAPQLAERRAGGTAYRAGDFRRALVHYARARAVVEFVRGSTPDDQSEVDRCLGRALWNEAAARMALQEWGAAVAACTRGLAALRAGAAAVDVAGEGSGAGPSGVASAGEAASLDPDLEARLLVRRAKAHLGRHDHRVSPLLGVDGGLLYVQRPLQQPGSIHTAQTLADAALHLCWPPATSATHAAADQPAPRPACICTPLRRRRSRTRTRQRR